LITHYHDDDDDDDDDESMFVKMKEVYSC